MTDCPVCGASGRLETITRERLPTMQNHRHTTRESALAAAYGELSILVCEKCGFAWNTTFEPALVRYDAEYENTVPSQIMAAHYEELVTGLTRRHDLSGGLVVDIGCGNASVLNMLMAAIPHSRGLGIDPALPRSAPEHDGRLRLVASPFAADLLEERPVLVLCRHVLEHIPDPISFLRTIVSATAELGPFPCYFEVPDLDWILRNEAFTDFCYEHCNYFTVGSLEQALLVAGFDPVSSAPASAGNTYGSRHGRGPARNDRRRPAASSRFACASTGWTSTCGSSSNADVSPAGRQTGPRSPCGGWQRKE